MSTSTMLPLPQRNTIAPALHVDAGAGHAAIAQEAEHRLLMLRSITTALAGTSMESNGKHDYAVLFDALTTLAE